jgi:hypothetical protein
MEAVVGYVVPSSIATRSIGTVSLPIEIWAYDVTNEASVLIVRL